MIKDVSSDISVAISVCANVGSSVFSEKKSLLQFLVVNN